MDDVGNPRGRHGHPGDPQALFAARRLGGEFEGDKIKRNSDYWNMAEFLAQVGILPQPPSA